MIRTTTLLIFLISVTCTGLMAQSSAVPDASKTEAPFRQNMGQWDKDILFQCLKSNNNVYFFKNRLSFGSSKRYGATQQNDFSANGMDKLRAGDKSGIRPHMSPDQMQKPDKNGPPPPPVKLSYMVWDVEFLKSNPDVNIVAEGKHESAYNYITGEHANHPLLHVPEYDVINYHSMYNGIDLKYYSANNNLKYDFIVKPGAASSDIQMCFHGVKDLGINAEGELEIVTAWETFRQATPVSWQTENNVRIPVEVSYVLLNDSTVGFKVADSYNPALELTIDPMHVDWSTYFYGTANQMWNWNYTWVADVHIDKNDYVYVTGMTYDKFPVTPGVYDTSFGGYADGFVCKMKQDGSGIIFFTYIGGSEYEYPFVMTGTDNGETFITGWTGSQDFPISSNAYQKTKGNGYPSFLTGLTNDGTALIYSTYVGGATGSWYYYSQAIEVNSKGQVYIGIAAQGSPVASFTTLGFVGGAYDAYVLKFNAAGSALLNALRIGGTEDDDINGIYADPNDNVYICGSTKSADLIPPGINNNLNVFGYQLNGQKDGYFIKIDSVFSKIKLAKYVGGDGNDMICSIYGDEKGEVFLSGITQSPKFNTANNPNSAANKFPVNYVHTGGDVVFVARMRSDGIKLKWLTYLGGSVQVYWDYPSWYGWWNGTNVGITSNIKEEPIIVGQTGDMNFPITPDAFQKTLKGSNGGYWTRDAFVTKLNYDGTVQFSSFYGGSSWEFFSGIKVRRIGCVSHVVIAGWTYSTDFPTTKGAWRETIVNNNVTPYAGGIVKIRDTLKMFPVNLGNDDVFCDRILKVLDGGNIGATYRWSTGDTTKTIKITKPGTYWVSGTYGCDLKADTVNIILKYYPKGPLFGKDTTYCHAINEKLDAKNDTIPDVWYKWNTSARDTLQTLTVNKAGMYAVQVGTKYCGSIYDTIKFKELHKPVLSLGRDSIFCGSVNRLQNVDEPKNETKYTWFDNDSVPVKTIKVDGQVWAEATNYCGKTADTVYYEINNAPVTTIGPDSVFCDSVSHTLFPDFLTINKYTKYKWSNGDTSNILKVKQPGTYWLNLKNSCGSSTDTIKLGMLTSPAINLGNDTTYCDNISLTLDAKNPNNKVIYTWGPVPTGSQTYPVSAPGKYYVQLKNKCRTVSDTINFKLLKTPTVYLGRDTNLCVTVSMPLDAGNAGNEATYLWDNGYDKQVYQATQPGIYGVTVSNYCGVAKDDIDVDVYIIPAINLGNDTVYCAFFPGRKLDAKNPNNLCTYQWSTGETSQVINPVKTGVYKVLIQNLCGTAEDSISLQVSPNPVVDLGKDTNYCDVFTYALDAGGSGNDQYLWTPTGETTKTITATEFGTHKVVVTNQYGCKSSDEMEIVNNCFAAVYVPNIFTPNRDKRNEVFKPSYDGVSEVYLVIWDRWGQKVFEGFTTDDAWDGSFQGQDCQEGVYIWQMTYKVGFKKRHLKGDLTLMR